MIKCISRLGTMRPKLNPSKTYVELFNKRAPIMKRIFYNRLYGAYIDYRGSKYNISHLFEGNI